MKPKLLYQETATGQQNVTYKAVYLFGGSKLRIDILRDSYAFQSHAKIERFDGDRWQFLESIHYSHMSSKRDQDKTRTSWEIADHQRDIDRLLAFAALILESEAA